MQKYKSRLHDLVICTVSSVKTDRPGNVFTVKQGGRTVHEDSGAHKVTICSRRKEEKAVTHAIQWLPDTSHSRKLKEPAAKGRLGDGLP